MTSINQPQPYAAVSVPSNPPVSYTGYVAPGANLYDANGQLIPPAQIAALLITTRSVGCSCRGTPGVLVSFLRGQRDGVALSVDGRRRNEAQGRHYFDLEHGECVMGCSFAQDDQRLLAIQFVTSKGRMSPVYAMAGYDIGSAPLTLRYAAGDRGEIEGLIRAKSRVLSGTIVLGFVHSGGIFLMAMPPTVKRTCLAVTCFAMNVLCCHQTCSGEKVVTGCCLDRGFINSNNTCFKKVHHHLWIVLEPFPPRRL